MKNHARLLCALAMPCAFPVLAQDDAYAFKDVSFNAFGWTQRTKDHTAPGPIGRKRNFNYVELQGGMGGAWGDVYGYLDIENPLNNVAEANPARDRRYVAKVIGNIRLAQAGGLPIHLRAQVYSINDNGFYDQNRVLGLSTTLAGAGWWVKPFFGLHQESKTGVGSHGNGQMLGWSASYRFKIGGESFALSNWHEIELNRKAAYLRMSRDGKVLLGSRTGQNGALGLDWSATPSVTLGVRYRYASNKLGYAGYQDGFILSARYSF